MVKVSVVIPTYNRKKYLKRAIKSVLQQSFRNFELIVVDNSSTDGTDILVKSLAVKFKQIKYYRNHRNIGMIANWNKGLHYASGTYCALLMDDDYWDKSFLKTTTNILDKFKNVGFVATRLNISESPNDARYRLYTEDKYVTGIDCLIRFLNNKWLVGLTSAVLFRTGYVDKFNFPGNEIEFWLKFAAKSDFYYIDRTLAYWTKNSFGSYSNSLKFQQYLNTRMSHIKVALKILSNNKINIKEIKKSSINYLNHELFEYKLQNPQSYLGIKYEFMYFKSKLKINLQDKSSQAGELLNINEYNRDRWIGSSLSGLKKNSKILDAGAGECKYKKYCTHLEYTSQDFAQYDGRGNSSGLQTSTWNNSNIDIVSDVTNIPVRDKSFDAILCTEVFEHIPDPIAAIKEFRRILKMNGKLIVTAPFSSLTHFAPYHFYTGFNIYFYRKILSENGFKIIKFERNGNYFDYLNQELRRLPEISQKYSNTGLNILVQIAQRILLHFLQKVSNRNRGSEELLTFGYHILAKKIK